MTRIRGILLLVAVAACQDAESVAEPEAGPAAVQQYSSEERGPDFIPGRFIVSLKEGYDAEDFAAEHGIKPDFVYGKAMTGFAGEISEAARSGMMRDARFMMIERDAYATTLDTQPAAVWGLDRIDQRTLPLSKSYQFNQTGTGVTVYVVDTGIRYTHAEFEGRAVPGFDAFGGDASDCHGHGTHVAGSVGGKTYGVAKGVKLVAVRVLSCTGSGAWSGIIAGLDWVLEHHHGPSVVNMSLGGGVNAAVDSAVARLTQAGVTVAVAAGNSNKDACTMSPAREPSALTIGAAGSDDVRASFSNYGYCVDWFAPGVSVTSAYHSSDAATATMSGTSMASPHSAGAAALFLQKYPAAPPQMVRDSLFAYTTKNVVIASVSANNHMLYSLLGTDGSTPPPRTGPVNIKLSVQGYKQKNLRSADLNWSGATSMSVDVYRNGSKLTVTLNDGNYADYSPKGNPTYRVCESGTSNCSPDVAVQY